MIPGIGAFICNQNDKVISDGYKNSKPDQCESWYPNLDLFTDIVEALHRDCPYLKC